MLSVAHARHASYLRWRGAVSFLLMRMNPILKNVVAGGVIFTFCLFTTWSVAAPATQSADPTARTTTRPATSPSGEDKSGDHLFTTTHSVTGPGGRTLD